MRAKMDLQRHLVKQNLLFSVRYSHNLLCAIRTVRSAPTARGCGAPVPRALAERLRRRAAPVTGRMPRHQRDPPHHACVR